jgi:hypothetical protein
VTSTTYSAVTNWLHLGTCGPRLMTQTHSIYDKRLLLYLDILGWSEHIRVGGGQALLEVLSRVHADTEVHNERFREELRTREKSGIVVANPIFLGVQCGAFSDHFSLSMPENFGGRILTAGTKLIVDLLHMGFLTRGAIVHGDLYHRDNMIFGPALNRAYEIESKEAFYPRIIVPQDVLEFLDEEEDGLIIADGSGRRVLNPFWLGFSVDNPEHEEAAVAQFEQLNQHLSGIKSIIESNITQLEAEGRIAHAEKWHYMHRFVEGPVLEAEARLRPYWK